MSDGPAVRVAGVSVEREGRTVLHEISFDLDAGRFLGIVGPNGAGKTTLLRSLLGLVRIARGRIELFGRPVGGRRSAATGVGYVPQRHQIQRAFPATARDVVAMGHLGPGRARRVSARAVASAEEKLGWVGAGHLADRPVGALSGGEQRRIMLAQALCASTRLLVLDEPTIGLDLPAEHEFYGLLRTLQADLGLTVIAVSHDLVALAGAADTLVCINQSMHVHGHPEDVIHSHAIREAYSCEFDFLAGEIAHHEGSGEEP